MKVVLVVVLAVALALPASASAATISLSALGSGLQISLNGSTRVVVSRVGSNIYVQGGPADGFSFSTCTQGSGFFDCGAGRTRITFVGSTGSDEFAISPDITIPVTANGLGGDDEISGAAGNDTLSGDNGTDILRGGGGNDVINGGDGADVILGELGVDTIDGSTGDDTMFGGGQAGDTLSYASRTVPVSVNLTSGGAVVAAEVDSVADFTRVLGGTAADALVGGPAAERLDGNGGNDVLYGLGGADTLNGGDGDDLVNARDAERDAAVSCGAGSDRLVNDAADPAAADCEVLAPEVTGAVTVSGEPKEGVALTAAFAGDVTGTASTRAWRWTRCDAAGACVLVGEQETYTPTAADAGATIVATLRAENAAGAADLASAGVGPVVGLPPAPQSSPPVVTAPVPARLSVRSARCAGRHCTLRVRVTGDVTRVRAVLTRGKTTVASKTVRSPTGTVTLRVVAKRTLRSGTYRLKTTVTGRDGKSRSSTRKIRIRR